MAAPNRPLSAVLATAVIQLATACATQQPPVVLPGASERPGSISALQVFDTFPMPDLYIADHGTRAVYHAEAFRGSLREPQPRVRAFSKAGAVQQPVDLAGHEDDLYVLDAAGPSIVELSSTGSADEITEGDWLEGASQLAISPGGRVAVFASTPAPRLVIGRLHGEVVVPLATITELPFDHVLELQFAGEELVVLDGKQIYTAASPRTSGTKPDGLDWEILPLDREYRSFAAYRGVYYLAGDESAAFVRGAKLAVRLPKTLIANANQIAVTRSELFFTTMDNRLEQAARPVPVALEVIGSQQVAAEAAVQLYSYLHSKGLLSTSVLTAGRDYQSMAEFLAERGFLVPATPAGDNGVRKRLQELLCGLNQCPGGDILSRPVHMGETWTVPSSRSDSSITLEPAVLGTQSLAAALAERFPDEGERETFSEDYIRRINNITEEEWPPNHPPPPSRRLLLPRRKWSLPALVFANDLKGRGPLAFQGATAVRVLSLEEVEVRKGCLEGLGNAETWEARLAKRAYACALIECMDAPDQVATLTPIAIAEAPIDKSHAAFCDADGASAWYEFTPQGSRPEATRCQPADGDFHLYDADGADHGTAIAGIIAGRGARGVSGLLGKAKLAQFDTDNLNAPEFGRRIDAAVVIGEVKLFNFSNVLDRLAGNEMIAYKNKVAGTPALFVVAAGNDGRRMDEVEAAMPLARFGALPNVLVVGASNACDDVLKELADVEGRKAGSNWGQLVHLVAPGFGMLAPGADGGYTEIGGTSLATALVTAAAGHLLSIKRLAPSVVKARLMYTADWYNQFGENQVIGGRLNVRRAVSHLENYTVRTNTNPGQLFAVSPNYSGAPLLRGRDVNLGLVQIKLEKVLRIAAVFGGRHRVVYLNDQGRFEAKDMLNLGSGESDHIPCSEASEWIEADHVFRRTPASDAWCALGIRPADLADYVAPVPSGEVRF